MIYGIKGGGGGGGGGGEVYSLVPSPSLSVHREAHGTLHAGKKKVSTVCGFHETVNYTGHSRIFSS